MAKILFIEEQRFRHNILWSFLLIAPIVVFCVILVYQLASEDLVRDHPMSNRSLMILLFFYGVPVAIIIYYVRLTTIISDESISYGWNIPTRELNVIKLDEIENYEVIEYSFVGWGYRLSRKYGTVYNVDGSKGLQIVTKSGFKVLIGTHHEEDLKKMITKQKL
jgi:hypothetical protein